MRNRPTKERTADRQEFVYKYREDIIGIAQDNKDIRSFIELIARPQLQYGQTTFYLDIWSSLVRTYVNMARRGIFTEKIVPWQ